jgi:hypothetical protein
MRTRRRPAAYLGLAAAVVAILTTVEVVRHSPRWVATRPPAAITLAKPLPAAPKPRTVALRSGAVYVDSAGFLSWALLDRRTGRISGSANLTAPSDTMSMVKSWIAADYLRLAAERGVTPRLGACLADGRAAGPRWTPWLLDEMRQVRGVGDFGVRAALPDRLAGTVAIKNGWLLRDEDRLWHISCLAIGDGWILGVLARYPGRLGFGYGARLCQKVGEQLLSPV